MTNIVLRRLAAAVLAGAMIIPAAACGEGGKPSPASDTAAPAGDDIAQTEAETEPDKFEGIDLGGAEIRVRTSVCDTDSTNANFLIEGTGAENGDVANDAVYKRNTDVEEMLNVKFRFTRSDENYDTAKNAVQKIILSGEDQFDIIIQDLMCMASLAVEGMFLDVSDQPIIDFDRSYWWSDYMADLSLGNGTAMYIMAGDYFMDVLCSAHALYHNKAQLENLTGDPDEIYKKVLDGSWTCDEIIKYIEMAYQDLNGDSAVNEGDNFGLSCIGVWGSAFGFYFCGDLKFVTRDADGVPSFFLDQDPRAPQTLEMLNKVFYNKGTYTKFSDYAPLRSYFTSGMTMFITLHRVGDLERFRDTEFDIGITPYPKLDEAQDHYVTTTNDTTEIGVIPVTCTQLETVCTVIEALCRETEKTVIPAYYETALKVKYARDDYTSQMLDMLHDNLNQSFAMAYNSYLGGNLLNNVFLTPLQKNSSDFASQIAKVTPKVTAALEKMIDMYNSNVG